MKRIFPLTLLGLVVVFVAVAGYFLTKPDFNPSSIPSALVSQTVPDFALEPVAGTGTPGLSSEDLKGQGLTLVNVFASWCGPCRAEHPILTRMSEQQDLRLVAINYKDTPENAAKWLDELGNPYARIGSDFSGRAGIDWGVTGVPETFIVSNDGIVLHRFPGPVVGDGGRRFQAAIDAAKAAQ